MCEDEPKLTGKQLTFKAEYFSNGFNATKAAIAAGYAPDSAHVEGSRLLRNAKVSAAIAKTFQERGIASETVQILLAILVFDADVADFDPWIKGEKTLEQLRAEGVDTRAVRTVTESPTGARRIELHNRLEAANQLAKIMGLLAATKTETTLTLASAMLALDETDENAKVL